MYRWCPIPWNFIFMYPWLYPEFTLPMTFLVINKTQCLWKTSELTLSSFVGFIYFPLKVILGQLYVFYTNAAQSVCVCIMNSGLQASVEILFQSLSTKIPSDGMKGQTDFSQGGWIALMPRLGAEL